MFAMGFLHGTSIFKTNSYLHTSYFLLIFLLIQKFVNRVFFVHSGNLLSRTEQAKPWSNIGSEAKREIKNPFFFPENPHVIKL